MGFPKEACSLEIRPGGGGDQNSAPPQSISATSKIHPYLLPLVSSSLLDEQVFTEQEACVGHRALRKLMRNRSFSV